MNTNKNDSVKSLYPRDTLPWRVPNKVFQDGSRVEEWTHVEGSAWLPEGGGWEQTFDIYRHDGQFWKLYRGRRQGETEPTRRFVYGGQACRMAEVRYLKTADSPHSFVRKQKGETEWVRVKEVDLAMHEVLRRGEG